ncbi:MAG TPA: InlB B-repeat-containing protein [Candidatus Limiplasma pullistercoris]|nr:InlB B-repeat-containing protein [Candidatus Limiplasma pullistercoris]
MKNGNGARLAALLLALALCLTACLPAALAQDYAGPSTADGWVDGTDSWKLESGKEVTYRLPFKSDKGILINSNASMTAPSIEVTGNVETSGSGKIVCAGLLSATGKVTADGITVGSLKCGEIYVGSRLIVKTSFSCTGKVEVNGMLILPGNTTQEEVKALGATGEGLILVGTKAYDTKGTPVEGASIYLTDGSDVSDDGFDWNSETCTLKLTDFTRNYVSGKINMAGINIDAPGKAVTLVLNGENNLTGLESKNYGIAVQKASLTLTGGGSLNCPDSDMALFVLGGSLELAEGCELQDNKEVFNAAGGGATIVESDDQAFATSFSLKMQQYDVTVTDDENGKAKATPASAAKGDTVTLTATPNPGYVFDRWEVLSGGVTIGSDNTFTMPGSAVEIKAYFKQAEYKVTLNTNGGTVNAGDVTGYVYGEGAKLPTDVTRDGYTFGGWYDNEALSGSRVTAITGTDTGDKTYWAKWTAIPGSAPVFTLPDGPQEVAVRPGERATLTAAATNATVCQWYVNRNDGAGYVKLSGATDMTYTTSAVTLDNDGYTYYCEASNAYGMGQSPIFTLRVSEAAAATPPQTGDDSHTGLWLALALVSLGGLCAAAYAVRRRRGGAR